MAEREDNSLRRLIEGPARALYEGLLQQGVTPNQQDAASRDPRLLKRIAEVIQESTRRKNAKAV